MGFSIMSGLAGFAEGRSQVLDEKRAANTRMLERHMLEGAEHLKDLRAKQTSRREAFDADRGSLAAMGISEENQARVMQGSVASRARTIVNLGKQRDTAEARGLTPNEAFMNSFFARPNRPAGINETDDTDSNTSVVPPGTVPDTVRSMNDSRLAAAGTIQGEAGDAPQHKGLGALFGKAKPLAYAGDGRTLTNDQGVGTASDVSDPTAGADYSKTLSQINKNNAADPPSLSLRKHVLKTIQGAAQVRYGGTLVPSGDGYDQWNGVVKNASDAIFVNHIPRLMDGLVRVGMQRGMGTDEAGDAAFDLFNKAAYGDADSTKKINMLLPEGIEFVKPSVNMQRPPPKVDPKAKTVVPLPDELPVTPKKRTFSDLTPKLQAEGRALTDPFKQSTFRSDNSLDRNDPLGGK
jgi:hypothetical protein